MLKKFGLPMMALAAVMALGMPRSAEARVRIGVAVGAPVYAAPVTPYPYAYPYADTYVDPYAYAPPAYVAPAPAYVDPYVTLGFGGGYARGYDHGAWAHGNARGFEGGGHPVRGGFHGRR